jgi:hypothetical protein
MVMGIFASAGIGLLLEQRMYRVERVLFQSVGPRE